MNVIKKGDIVVRKSYNKDVIFIVKSIIKNKDKTIVILKGVVERIEADSNIEDLELLDIKSSKFVLEKLDNRISTMIEEENVEKIEKKNNVYRIGILTQDKRAKEKIITGKILHLDGDRNYSEKSYMYYRKLGLNAIVKHIPEYKQPHVVYKLLSIYKPDILVVTRT